jgi:hypothetical protein
LAAISRAKKSSIRLRPRCENPASSGPASGNGAALAAVRAIPAIIVAIVTIVFFIVSSRENRRVFYYAIELIVAECLEHARTASKSSASEARR